jgi:hypothetical protein
MVWPLSHLITLSLLLQGRKTRPPISVLLPRPDHRNDTGTSPHLSRAQARAVREATLLQALKMNGGSFWS